MILSIVCSGYRSENFEKLYDSIEKSFSGEWELIICGPNAPTFEAENFLFIQDYGSPARCCQRALLMAKGDYVSFAWDDGVYLPGMLDKLYVVTKAGFENLGIVGKFYETKSKGYC